MIQNESKRKAGKKNGLNLPKFTMKRLEVNCFLLSQNKGNCGLNTNLLKFITTQRPTQSISQIQYLMLLFFRPILKTENFDLMILVQRTFFRISSHHFDQEGIGHGNFPASPQKKQTTTSYTAVSITTFSFSVLSYLMSKVHFHCCKSTGVDCSNRVLFSFLASDDHRAE